MQALKARVPAALNHNTYLEAADNSGAKMCKITAILGSRGRTVKGRQPAAGVGDAIMVVVKTGKPDVRKQVIQAVIVRQKKEFRRPDGTRVAFEDNAVVLLKDEFGSPKGTLIKGPIAKEVAERWPSVAKIAMQVV